MALLTRRRFLHRAAGLAAVAAAPNIVPATALGLGGRPAPSERLVLGAIGMGGMGRHDLGNFLGEADVQVVAVCDVDASRLKFAKETVDKHYGNADCAATGDWREVVARDDLDAVLVATPDHWHAYIAIAAAQTGKHLYCEKPISLTVSEGRIVAKAMNRFGVTYQSGTQRRSIDCFRFAVEMAQTGKVGRLHTIHVYLAPGRSIEPQPVEPVPPGFDYDMWLGQAPNAPYTAKRCHASFRWIYDYSGGQLTDIGAHFIDLAQWGNGSEYTGPVTFEGRAEFPKEGLYNTPVNYHVTAGYANGIKLEYHDTEPRAVKFEGDEGWVSVNDDGVVDAEPKSILGERVVDRQPWSHNRPHIRNFIDCVRSGAQPVAPPEVAHRSTTICHLGNLCLRLGRPLKWNPILERIEDDDEAQAMLSRPMRAPWDLNSWDGTSNLLVT